MTLSPLLARVQWSAWPASGSDRRWRHGAASTRCRVREPCPNALSVPVVTGQPSSRSCSSWRAPSLNEWSMQNISRQNFSKRYTESFGAASVAQPLLYRAHCRRAVRARRERKRGVVYALLALNSPWRGRRGGVMTRAGESGGVGLSLSGSSGKFLPCTPLTSLPASTSCVSSSGVLARALTLQHCNVLSDDAWSPIMWSQRR
jgi:hypothetical protein